MILARKPNAAMPPIADQLTWIGCGTTMACAPDTPSCPRALSPVAQRARPFVRHCVRLKAAGTGAWQVHDLLQQGSGCPLALARYA